MIEILGIAIPAIVGPIILIVLIGIIGYVLYTKFRKESYVGSGGQLPGLPNRALEASVDASRAVVSKGLLHSPGCILRETGCKPIGLVGWDEVPADSTADQ